MNSKAKTIIKEAVMSIAVLALFTLMYILGMALKFKYIDFDDYVYTFDNWYGLILNSLIIGAIVMLIPYELIGRFWERFIYKDHVNYKGLIATLFVLVVICVMLLVCLDMDIYELSWIAYDYPWRSIAEGFVPMLVLYLMLRLHNAFGNAILNFICTEILLLINGLCLNWITGFYYSGLLTTVGLAIAWCAFEMMSEKTKKQKVITVLSCIGVNLVAFVISIFALNKTHQIELWFNPGISNAGSENALLQSHAGITSQFNDASFINRHPFATMFYGGSYGYLAVYILAFVLIGVIIVCSRKMLSKDRYHAVLGMYIVLATTFVYSMLADFGLLPTFGRQVYVISYTFMCLVGLFARSFITLGKGKVETITEQ